MATQCDVLPADVAHSTSDIANSDGSHLTADTVVAFAFYNVGIQNSEILGTAWNKSNSEKQERLRNDIAAIFAPHHGMQILFISEFGQMGRSIDEELKGRGVAQPATKLFLKHSSRTQLKFYRSTCHATICSTGGSKLLARARMFEVRQTVHFPCEFCYEACLGESSDRHQSWRFQLPYS